MVYSWLKEHYNFCKCKGDLTMSGKVIVNYKTDRLSTISSLFMCYGTVWGHPVMWTEQLMICVLFIFTALVISGLPDSTIKRAMNSFEDDLTVFLNLLTTMVTFLVSFYMNLVVTRWWRLRTEGIGVIWASCTELCAFLHQMTQCDDIWISSIKRYARASLFFRQLMQLGHPDPIGEAVTKKLITDEESALMRKLSTNNYSEAVWGWIIAVINKVQRQGLFRDHLDYIFVMNFTQKGRNAAQLINAQMGCPVPFAYVHLMSGIVKAHNVIMSITLAAIFVQEERIKNMSVVTIVVRLFVTSYIFNGLLLVSISLSDPFDGTDWDFPMWFYNEKMEADAKMHRDMYLSLPDFLVHVPPKKEPRLAEPQADGGFLDEKHEKSSVIWHADALAEKPLPTMPGH